MRSEKENWRDSRTSRDKYGTLFHEIAIGQVTYLPDIAPSMESGIYPDHEREELRVEQQLFLQAMTSIRDLEGDDPPAIDLRVGKPAGFGTTPKLFIALAGRVTEREEVEAKKNGRTLWSQLSTAVPRSYGFTEPATNDTLFLNTVLPSLEDLENASILELVKVTRATPRSSATPRSNGNRFIYSVGTYSEMLNSMIRSWEAIARSPERVLLSVRCVPLPLVEAEEVRKEISHRYQSYTEDAGRLQDTPIVKDALQRFDNLLSSMLLLRLRIQVASWDGDAFAVKSEIMASLTTPFNPQQRSCECYWHPCKAEQEKKQAQAEIAYVYAEKREPDVSSQTVYSMQQDAYSVSDHDLVNVREASAVWRLPLAWRYGISAIQFKRNPLFTPEAIPLFSPSSAQGGKPPLCLGTVVNKYGDRQQQLLDVSILTRHMLILGETGSGKSTTTQSLVYQLWKEKIPSMVIDPVSTEYCELWALSSIFRDDPSQSLLIFNPGAAGEKGTLLAFNPFCPQPKIGLDAHIMSLKECFSSALSLPEWWKELVGRAIRNVYEDFGWPAGDPEQNREPITDTEREERLFPTLVDFIKAVEREISLYGSTEYRSNTEAALLGRLRDLAAGPLGALVNTQRGLNVPGLVNRPVVIQLRSIRQPDAKSLIILFLLTQLRQHYDSWKRSRNIKHLLIVEEAHRLLSPSPVQVEIDKGSDSRAESIQIIVDMLAELRKVGAGIALVEQLPSRLEANVVKLPGVKILHRLSARDDREMIAQAMNMTPIQTKYVATLEQGQATLYAEGAVEPVLLQIANHWEEIKPPERWYDRPELPEDQEKLEREVEDHTLQAWPPQIKEDEPWNPCRWCRCGCRPRMQLLEKDRSWWMQIDIDNVVSAAWEEIDKGNIQSMPQFAKELWEQVEQYSEREGLDERSCGLTLALERHVTIVAKITVEKKKLSYLEDIKYTINEILRCIDLP